MILKVIGIISVGVNIVLEDLKNYCLLVEEREVIK